MTHCETCGMPMNQPEHFALGDTSSTFCVHCVDEDGTLKSAEDIFAGGVQFFMNSTGADRVMAEKITRKNMNQQTYWQDKEEAILQGEEATDDEFAEAMAKMRSDM